MLTVCVFRMAGVHNVRLSHSRARVDAGPMTSSRAIAVLGLGRMGAAIAARLVSTGWEVTGWTRSGRAVDSDKMADDPDDAVANADVVILALFDVPDCAQVLYIYLDYQRPDALL